MTAPQVAPAPGAASPSLPRFMVPLLGITAGIQTIDPMISTVALVKASSALRFGPSTLAFASGISTLALAATVIPTGLFADRFGRRRVLMAALVVAALGDAAVALSPGTPMFLLGRAVTGVGLGAVFGASFAYISAVGKQRLGAALGVFTATAAAATLAGAFVGGVLADASWRAAFLVVPLLCLVSLAVIPRVTPPVPRVTGTRPDYLGMTLLAVGAVGILSGLSNASASLSAPRTWLPVVIGAVAFALFALAEAKVRFPAFPIGLFRSPVFIAAVIAGLAWNGAQSATVLQLSNLWQYAGHYSTLSVTLGQLPFSIVAVASALAAGQWLHRGASPRHLITIAVLLMAAGFVTLHFIPNGFAYADFLPALVLIGAGTAGASVPQAQLFMSEAPADHFGPVTSSRLAIGQFGFAFGLAGSSVLVSSLTFAGVTKKLLAAGVPPARLGEGLDAVTSFVNTGREPGSTAGWIALHSARASYVHAFNTTMVIAAALLAAAGAAAFLLLRPRPAPASAAPAGPRSRAAAAKP